MNSEQKGIHPTKVVGPSRRGPILTTLLLVLVVLIPIIGIVGCVTAPSNTKSGAVTGIPVQVVTAERGTIESVTSISGKVLPITKADIVAKTPGRVESVRVAVGSTVKKGDTLLTLETKELSAQVRAAKAGLEMAQARLKQYTGGDAADSAAIRQAELALDLARANYDRMETLFAQGAISKSQLETAKSQLAAAEMGYESAKQQYEIALAQVKQAQASLEMAQTALGNATIISPIDGIVSSVSLNPGEMASPGIPIVTVVDVSRVKVETDVSESTVNLVKPGLTVKVSVTAASDKAFTGTISAVSPSADPRTKNYLVEVLLDNQDGLLKPGMFASVDLPLQRNEDTTVVPRECLVRVGDNYVAYLVESDKAKQVQVEVGIVNSKQAEIIEGVKPGDKVVAVGQASLSDGSTVTVVE